MVWKHLVALALLALVATTAALEDRPPNFHAHGYENHLLHTPNEIDIQKGPHSPISVKLSSRQEKLDEDADPEEVNEDAKILLKISQNDKELSEDTEDSQDEVEEKKVASLMAILKDPRASNHVACDWLTSPRFYCYDCNSYVECKDSGGKIKGCKSWAQPYCNGGVCSATPSAECEALVK